MAVSPKDIDNTVLAKVKECEVVVDHLLLARCSDLNEFTTSSEPFYDLVKFEKVFNEFRAIYMKAGWKKVALEDSEIEKGYKKLVISNE